MWSFNLVSEPWIPCLLRNEQLVERSLLEVLTAPRDVREIVHPSPLVTVALHRLLLAILHRALDGPCDEDDWSTWWQQGCWPIDPVRDYLARWQHRFDLFDPQRPFYQDPQVDRKYAAESARLAMERASSYNAPLLFDHSDPERVPLVPAEAAQYLIAFQLFSPGGLLSGPTPNERSSKAAPLCNVAVCLGKGVDLARTLLLNLVPVRFDRGYDPPSDQCDDDLPAWERPLPAGDRPRWPCGYVDYLTWQARRVLLLPEHRNGTVVVPRAVIMRGESFPDGFEIRQLETMVAFRTNRKKGVISIRFEEGRALWRDSLALTRTVGTSDGELEQPPRVVRWWAPLARVGLLAESIIPVDVAGAIADQAKPLFWRYERFPLPLAILDDADALRWLEGFLSMAEKAVQQLASELRRLVIELGVAKEQVGRFVAALGADGAYWSALEPLFYPLLHRLAQPGADRQALCDEWLSHVRGAALDAFQLAARSVEASSRAELLTADAERRLRQALRELAWRGNTIEVGNGSPEVEEVAT